ADARAAPPRLSQARRALPQGASPEELRPRERRGAGDDRVAVGAEPLLEQCRIDGAEVGGRTEIPLVVEPAADAGELALQVAVDARADDEADSGRSVVGAGRAVLARPAAELRPDVDEHTVGDAPRFEVALEREQGVRRRLQAVAQRVRLRRVRVE